MMKMLKHSSTLRGVQAAPYPALAVAGWSFNVSMNNNPSTFRPSGVTVPFAVFTLPAYLNVDNLEMLALGPKSTSGSLNRVVGSRSCRNITIPEQVTADSVVVVSREDGTVTVDGGCAARITILLA